MAARREAPTALHQETTAETSEIIQPWPLRWTPVHVARFWAYYAARPPAAQAYFADLYGESILARVQRFIHLRGSVVDLGSGPGYLTGRLIARNCRVLPVDQSAESIERLRQRIGHEPLLVDARVSSSEYVPVEDDFADILFLVEAIEHLDDDVLPRLLDEIRRILKPGGHLVVTTPNDEDLQQRHVMCPHCACEFHTLQHLRAFTSESLKACMERAGFTTIVSTPTVFTIEDRVVSTVLQIAHSPLVLKLLGRIGQKKLHSKLKPPHLLYIGRLDC